MSLSHWMRDVKDRVVIGVRMFLGDTRPKEVREAPCSCMGQNKAPNRENRVVMTNEYYQRPRELVFTPEMAQQPLTDARKPVLTRTDLPSAAYFSSLVNLGLFDPRCNLNGFTNSWGFQVLYDKQELRMFRYPVVHHSPTVILSSDGMTRMMDIDFPLDEVYSVLNAMRDHVMAQNLVPSKIRWVEEYEKLVKVGLYHPDLDLAALPGEWVFFVPKGARELHISYRSGREMICVIDEASGEPVVTYNPNLEEWQKDPGVVVPLLFIYPYIAVKNLNDKEKQ